MMYMSVNITKSVLIATVSSRRYTRLVESGEVSDPSGDIAERLFRLNGFRDIKRVLIRDDESMIREVVDMARKEGYPLIVFIGGTGVAKDDITVETLHSMFTKDIPGFNILYTLYSEKEIGVRAMSSRASAGFIGDILVYAIPGSPKAVELCIKKLIIPEYEHLMVIRRGLKH